MGEKTSKGQRVWILIKQKKWKGGKWSNGDKEKKEYKEKAKREATKAEILAQAQGACQRRVESSEATGRPWDFHSPHKFKLK